MIWLATQNDHARVVELGKKFHAGSVYAGLIPVDDADWSDFAAKMIENPNSVIFMSETGMCGAMLNPAYWNYSATIAAELFWYDEDGSGAGKATREAVELWAADSGAIIFQMTIQANEKEPVMRRLLRWAGFKATEVTMMKRIS